MSAWATGRQLVLGRQEAVPGKSNEIVAIPLLLRRLELTGALVVIDAMVTQTRIAQTILDGGGYVLALKQNRPASLTEVEALFAAPPASLAIAAHATIDGGHGRVETRTHRVRHDVGWLFSGHRYPGAPVFPGLAMLGTVECRTERDGKVERERRYCLCSTRLDAKTFARVVRRHGGIENRLHWALDVVFRDDLARPRSAHGPANMAVVKHMALNLLKQAKPTGGPESRRKRTGWNTDHLAAVIQQAK